HEGTRGQTVLSYAGGLDHASALGLFGFLRLQSFYEELHYGNTSRRLNFQFGSLCQLKDRFAFVHNTGVPDHCVHEGKPNRCWAWHQRGERIARRQSRNSVAVEAGELHLGLDPLSHFTSSLA